MILNEMIFNYGEINLACIMTFLIAKQKQQTNKTVYMYKTNVVKTIIIELFLSLIYC